MGPPDLYGGWDSSFAPSACELLVEVIDVDEKDSGGSLTTPLARENRQSEAARHHRPLAIPNGSMLAHSLAVNSCLSLIRHCVHVCTDRNDWLDFGPAVIKKFRKGRLQAVELDTP